MTTNRRMRASSVRALQTQYRAAPRVTSLVLAPLLAIAVLVVAACGGGDSITGTASVPGNYQLSTVQGKALPYRVFSDTNYSLDVSQGTLALRSDGSFTATMRTEERVEGHLSVYADTAIGTWSATGSIVKFVTPDGTQSATLSGTSLVIVDSSFVAPVSYSYSKQ